MLLEILKEFPDQKSNILMLPPFSLWIDFDDPLKGQSMIKLKVLEENLKTRESGFAISRVNTSKLNFIKLKGLILWVLVLHFSGNSATSTKHHRRIFKKS